MNLRGRVAVITGAGSGIGRATAFAMARRGARLALADIDGAAVAAVARAIGPAATYHVLDVAEADFDWLMDITTGAPGSMTRAFLPLLHASDDARIVNVSSIYGIVAPPGQAAHAASKFAVRGLSAALRHELEGSTVHVSVVHPGGVATQIARNARVPAGVPPEDVERRRARILVGSDAKAAALLERLAPVGYWNLLKKAIKR